MPAPKGDLVLDSKEGLLKGGVSGPALVPGKPADSRLFKAISYTDPTSAQMPPSGKLPDTVVADFEQWIARGAADPRASVPALAAEAPQYKGMSLEDGRKWWAFQPVAVHPAPKPAAANGWPKTKIDNFVLAKLQEKKLDKARSWTAGGALIAGGTAIIVAIARALGSSSGSNVRPPPPPGS